MSRRTNFIGFTENAKKYMKDNLTYLGPTGKIVEGMFDEYVHEIDRYIDKNGDKYIEYVQAEPWSSGPCIFMAIKNEETNIPVKETLWSEEEIDNC